MAEKENKFVVFKRDDLKRLFKDRPDLAADFDRVTDSLIEMREAEGKGSPWKNLYIVCNWDEPYAEDVWQTILRGEDAKRK